CRTDADQPKHRGLTGFVVDMKAPGVEVRPLRQMTGGASFNEVFFTDVRVPDDHRLGDVNQGWTVALTTLMNERAAIGAGGAGGSGMVSTARLVELLHHYGSADDAVLRPELTQLHVNLTVAPPTNARGLDQLQHAHGQAGPDPEHDPGGRLRGPRARAPAGGRHRRVGHLLLEPVRAGHPRHA